MPIKRKVCISLLHMVMFHKVQFTCTFMKLHSGPATSREWGRDLEGMWFPKSSWRNSLCLLCSSARRLLSWACSSTNEGFLRHTYTNICIKINPPKKTITPFIKQNLSSESSTSWPQNSQFPVLLSWPPSAVIYPAVSSPLPCSRSFSTKVSGKIITW